MSGVTTIREHLEAIIADLHSTDVSYTGGMLNAGMHAAAAIRLLDKAAQVALVGKGSASTTEDWRLIFDPDSQEDA